MPRLFFKEIKLVVEGDNLPNDKNCENVCFVFTNTTNSQSNIELDTRIAINGNEHFHLTKSLRKKVGDATSIRIDNISIEAETIVEEIKESQSILRVTSTKEINKASYPHLIIANIKPKRLELLIEKAVEVGVSEISIFKATHSQFALDRNNKKINRFEQIAISAIKQSGAGILPKFNFYSSLEVTLKELKIEENSKDISKEFSRLIGLSKLDTNKQVIDFKELFQEKRNFIQNETEKFKIVQKTSDLYLIIGPEGGLTDYEIKLAFDKGFVGFSLGESILRAETASILALWVMKHLHN